MLHINETKCLVVVEKSCNHDLFFDLLICKVIHAVMHAFNFKCNVCVNLASDMDMM